METSLVVTLILGALSGIVSVIVAVINNSKLKKNSIENKMFAAKQSILQMVNADYVSVDLMKKPPRNYTRILYEYDIYKNNGGNSDIDEVIKEYLDWYSKLTLKED